MHPIDSPIIDLRLNTSSAPRLPKTNHQHPSPIKMITSHLVGYFDSTKLALFSLVQSVSQLKKL